MKCLILCMGCNNSFYRKEWEDAKNTWAKDILDGKYPDLDIIMYTSSETNEYAYDKNEHILYVPANDSLIGTFEKTVKALQSLSMFNIFYDCILRTNCSTIINVKLLDTFIHSDIYDPNKIYSGELYTCGYKAAPYENSLFARGNFILMQKYFADLINYTSLEMTKQINDYNRIISKDMFIYDDITIYAIFNTCLLTNGINPLDVYQRMPIQYLYNIYFNNEELYSNNIAFFIKPFGDKREIHDIYNEYKEILNNFYSNYYNILTDNLDNLKSDFEELKFIEKHVAINENSAQIYQIPYSEYKQ